MKSLRRYNRASGGTKSKVELIVREVRARYPGLECRNGGDVFSAWKSIPKGKK